jgi:hypothetical protein
MLDHKQEKINFEEIKMKSKYRRAQVYVSLLTTIVPSHYADRAGRDVQPTATPTVILVTHVLLAIEIPYKLEYKETPNIRLVLFSNIAS